MRIKNASDNVRKNSPIIHNITNYVTVNDVANVLLACGASPIMADDKNDVEEITSICSGLNLNIGTLNERTVESMFIAGRRASELGHVINIDPVGAGASHIRTETAAELIRELDVTTVRGNISEIKAVASELGIFRNTSGAKGVDADAVDLVTEDNLEQSIEFIKEFARQTETVTAATGAIDIVTDGNETFIIRNGRPEMSKVTGTGCQLSSLVCAFVAANKDDVLAGAAAAVITMGVAGEIGHEHLQDYEGNSTYRNRIIDAICNMTGDKLEERGKYEKR